MQIAKSEYRKINKLSASDIKLFNENRYKFYVTRVLGEKQEDLTSPPIVLGQLCDFILSDCRGSLDEFDKRFDEKFKLLSIKKGSGQMFLLVDELFKFTLRDMDEEGNITSSFSTRFEEAFDKLQSQDKFKGKKVEWALEQFRNSDEEIYFQECLDSIGRLLFFMKKFFLPLWANRYFKIRGDWEVGDVAEGHYYAFYDTIMKDFYRLKGNLPEILAKWKLSPEEGGYTELQKQAIKKTLAEFAIIAAIFISLGLLGYDDDEDDSDSVKFAQYIALKLKREVGLFTPFAATQELTSLIERPFIAVGAASNVIDLVGTTAKLPFNWAFDAFEDDLYYQRKTALWDKGDSKIISLLLKTAGVQVAITNPEQLLQSYKYSIR